jgi:hypothetical protein
MLRRFVPAVAAIALPIPAAAGNDAGSSGAAGTTLAGSSRPG